MSCELRERCTAPTRYGCTKSGEDCAIKKWWYNTEAPEITTSLGSAELPLLYGGMSPEYVLNMEKHRNILIDALAEIKAASDSNNLDRVKEVVAGSILEIRAI